MVSKSLLGYIASMVIYGTISIFVKNIAVSPGEIAFWRVVIALIAILTFKLIRHEHLPFRKAKGDLFLLSISGLAIAGAWILFFGSFDYTSVSMATMCSYFSPTLLMVFAPLVFKEKISLKQWLYFLMASLGLVLTIGAKLYGSEGELKGIIFALLSAFCYAFVVIVNKQVKSISGIDKTIFQFAAAALVLAVYVSFTSGFHVAELSSKGLINLAILGLVHTGFTYCLYFSVIENMTGQKVAILGYIDPFVAAIVSVALLNEAFTIWQLFGGIMIIGFTVLNELGSFKRDKSAADRKYDKC
ncbi:MAG: EamA/RhaT family transporter [Clostridia bacterium]|nr:EamA/RhaT family transporter [Clostridia bacterium]